MKLFTTLVAISLFGCSAIAESTNQAAECHFDFHTQAPCVQGDYKVSIHASPLAADEIQLQALQVDYHGKQQLLSISPDTSLLEGDKSIILFEDINFDGSPDIAISTSFGLANQYMDYWVFDKVSDRFIKVGNHARFTLHPADKTLSNTVKVDAASYQKQVFTWQGDKLVKKQVQKK